MKKVSFIKGFPYNEPEVEFLPSDIFSQYFNNAEFRDDYDYICLESFTCEITVKIVPYEQV